MAVMPCQRLDAASFSSWSPQLLPILIDRRARRLKLRLEVSARLACAHRNFRRRVDCMAPGARRENTCQIIVADELRYRLLSLATGDDCVDYAYWPDDYRFYA